MSSEGGNTVQRPNYVFSLRSALIATIVILLVVTAHTIGIVTFVNSRSSINELSRALFQQISMATQQRVKAHLNPAYRVVQESHTLAQRSLLPIDSFDKLGDRLAERLRYESSLSELTFGDHEGRFVGAARKDDQSVELRRSHIGQDGKTVGFSQQVEISGKKSPQKKRSGHYDPRERPWYKLATESNAAVWTTPYPWSNGDMGITCARAIKDNTGVRGVLTADFRLNSLSSFLKSIKIGETGKVYLINREGLLIASPEGQSTRLDPILNEVLETTTQWKKTPSQKAMYYPLQYKNRAYAVEVQFFELNGGLNWGTVIIVPENEFLGKVYRTAKFTILIAAIALFLAILVGLFVASQIATPLQNIAIELHKVGAFRLDDENVHSSYIREVSVIQDSVDLMKSSLKSFSRYVPTELVRDLLKEGREATLGGESRVLTIHFSDIEGFTGISEGRQPEELVRDLASYLEAMVSVLKEEQGTIDKFMGDGILAFFNAPSLVYQHPSRSCRSALKAQARLTTLRTQWKSNNQPEFRARIGLHTGEVLVGNIGTETRFSYTVIGDAVNVAARLEALNKAYGTYIMVSEETKEQSGQEFEWRRLDTVAVLGRTKGLVVYELLGLVGSVPTQALEFRDQYEAALNKFQERGFAASKDLLTSLIRTQPGDKSVQLLLSRVQECIDQPPGDDWTPIFRQRTK
jgi:adenylate cyclase